MSNHKLGLVGVCMLQDWLQPQRGMVWSEPRVFGKLQGLRLAPEQQSTVDNGVRVDQFGLARSHSQQPFNDLKRRLIDSICASRQAATLLMAKSDQVAGHCHTIDQALKHAYCEAFLPVRKREIYNLDPKDTAPWGAGSRLPGSHLPRMQPRVPRLRVHHGGLNGS